MARTRAAGLVGMGILTVTNADDHLLRCSPGTQSCETATRWHYGSHVPSPCPQSRQTASRPQACEGDQPTAAGHLHRTIALLELSIRLPLCGLAWAACLQAVTARAWVPPSLGFPPSLRHISSTARPACSAKTDHTLFPPSGAKWPSCPAECSNGAYPAAKKLSCTCSHFSETSEG